jgi:hypothetical protein
MPVNPIGASATATAAAAAVVPSPATLDQDFAKILQDEAVLLQDSATFIQDELAAGVNPFVIGQTLGNALSGLSSLALLLIQGQLFTIQNPTGTGGLSSEVLNSLEQELLLNNLLGTTDLTGTTTTDPLSGLETFLLQTQLLQALQTPTTATSGTF